MSGQRCGERHRMAVSAHDVRRLLRVLGNPVALRRDPLAACLVGEGKADIAALQERADRVLAIVRASLSSMCSHAGAHASNERMRRAAAIVERCDLAGGSHDDVAADLGIARRQFYRDRGLALDALALELGDLLRSRSAPPSIDGAAHFGFEIAEALAGVGKYDDVETLLNDIASSAPCDDRFRASARGLETACESGERVRIERALAHARNIASSPEVPSTFARLRFDLAVLQGGELLDGTECDPQRLASLDALRSSHESSDERWEALALGLTQHATAAHTMGDFGTALASLHEAEAVIRRCERPAKTFAAYLPNLLGVSLMMMPRSLDAASEQHRLAIELGRARGLMRIVIASTLNDCAIELWQGRAHAVCDRAIETLAGARAVMSHDEFGRSAILTAKIALGAGRLDEALKLLEEVKGSNGNYLRLRPRAILVEAEVMLQVGDVKRACKAARAAVNVARRSGEASLVGTALLFNAEALAATHQRSLARRTLREATQVLQRSGSPHALGRALKLAERLA
jgi:tetratricopeptide (TPR) repeat protein